MSFKNCLLLSFLLPLIVPSTTMTPPVILIDAPSSLTVYKGQSAELTCFASTTSPNETEFKWILPEVELYIKEDRDKRVEEVTYDFGSTGQIKIMKLKIPSIKYQDRGEYVCVGNHTGGDAFQVGRILVVVEEHSGFAPAFWILVGFLLMTVISIAVIMVMEMRGVTKTKEEVPINTVQF